MDPDMEERGGGMMVPWRWGMLVTATIDAKQMAQLSHIALDASGLGKGSVVSSRIA